MLGISLPDSLDLVLLAGGGLPAFLIPGEPEFILQVGQALDLFRVFSGRVVIGVTIHLHLCREGVDLGLDRLRGRRRGGHRLCRRGRLFGGGRRLSGRGRAREQDLGRLGKGAAARAECRRWQYPPARSSAGGLAWATHLRASARPRSNRPWPAEPRRRAVCLRAQPQGCENNSDEAPIPLHCTTAFTLHNSHFSFQLPGLSPPSLDGSL